MSLIEQRESIAALTRSTSSVTRTELVAQRSMSFGSAASALVSSSSAVTAALVSKPRLPIVQLVKPLRSKQNKKVEEKKAGSRKGAGQVVVGHKTPAR